MPIFLVEGASISDPTPTKSPSYTSGRVAAAKCFPELGVAPTHHWVVTEVARRRNVCSQAVPRPNQRTQHFKEPVVFQTRIASSVIVIARAALAFSLMIPIVSSAQSAKVVKNIVLVHGAFADGSSWSKVIPLLEADGYHVVAVQNPLTSLADDVAATKRMIALQDGPVILVGHSWGGAVITQAGGDPKVAALVYVAAYAPDVGQSANDASTPFGITEGQKQIRVDSQKFATMTSQGILEDFAQGLPMADRKLVLAVQGDSFGPMFDEKLTTAAWKSKRSWVVISANDRMLPPAMERDEEKKLNATATVLPTCHVAMLQEPAKVAAVISDAAKKALNR
jgi:pimeloyl-ACP methyl ester carboxylesterase